MVFCHEGHERHEDFLERIAAKKHSVGSPKDKRDKKTVKKHLFLVILFCIEIRTLSRIISLKCTESKNI